MDKRNSRESRGSDNRSSDIRRFGPTPWRDGNVEGDIRHVRHSRGELYEEPRKKTRIFRGNRGLMITLIDVAIVTVILIVFYTVLQPLSHTVVIPPYRVTIDRSVDEDQLSVEAVVQYRRPTLFSNTQDVDTPDVQPVVTIGPVDGDITITDLAPREGGRRRMNLTIPIRYVEELEQLALNIQIGDEERVYLIDLR